MQRRAIGRNTETRGGLLGLTTTRLYSSMEGALCFVSDLFLSLGVAACLHCPSRPACNRGELFIAYTEHRLDIPSLARLDQQLGVRSSLMPAKSTATVLHLLQMCFSSSDLQTTF